MATWASKKPVKCMKPFEIAMMDGYCLHSVSTNQTLQPVFRTFVRLVFTQERYQRHGNTRNPFMDYDGWEWDSPQMIQAPAALWKRAEYLLPSSSEDCREPALYGN